MRVLVTGAAGSIGSRVCELLAGRADVVATDLVSLDVTDADTVERVAELEPDVVLHLAGAKSAPDGELSPLHTTVTNVVGTAWVLAGAERVRARVVTASTCKACDPETVYGASKLVAERLTLNAGGSVVRFFNVRESSGNVFRLWESLPRSAAIPVCDAWRFFVSLEQAASLCVAALSLPPGRYAPDPGKSQHMLDVAMELYRGREFRHLPLRRGDRFAEPLMAACEKSTVVASGVLRIEGKHDAMVLERVAA